MVESLIRDVTQFFTTFGDQLIMSTLLFFTCAGNVLNRGVFKPGTSEGIKLLGAFIGASLVVLVSPFIYMFVVNHFPFGNLKIDFMGATVLVYLMVIIQSMISSSRVVDNSQTS